MSIKISNVANLPSKYGDFKIQSFQEDLKEHLVIFKEPLSEVPIIRIHSECLTGDTFGSKKCDCGEQLEYALETIEKSKGMIIYLRQEGRGIGLFNKTNAYSLQDEGLDTVEANHKLGFQSDERDYSIVKTILEYYNIKKVRLLTNNPQKVLALNSEQIIERLPIIMPVNIYNKKYLETKKRVMAHLL